MKQPKFDAGEPFNFTGLTDQTYEKAKAIIFPVPYSSTTYWNPGTKFGPQALIEASRHLELFDLELKLDISSKLGIYTLDPLAPSKNSPEEVVEQIDQVVSQLFADGKFPVTLGGEHSIALGPIRAAAKKFKNLSVLQIDAHTDLRDEYEGTRFHHGCVMGRVVRDLKLPVTQVGIRSVSEEEMGFIKKSKREKYIFYAPDLPMKKILKTLKQNVYLSFDLDGLDPAIMSATGTPEPGGLSFYQVLDLIKAVAKRRNLVGLDIVELSPLPGISAPNFLAAKLAYKIIGYSLIKEIR
ncbi:MAG: agmatinase [Candidatus Daviesbacteria bacterium]|nr:MAG: agmatinase [Candidatus Daviesbacteria bacterium]